MLPKSKFSHNTKFSFLNKKTVPTYTSIADNYISGLKIEVLTIALCLAFHICELPHQWHQI